MGTRRGDRLRSFARGLLFIVVGFALATAAVIGLSFAGINDPASVGGVHLVVWGLATWGLFRLTRPTGNPSKLDGDETASPHWIGPDTDPEVAGDDPVAPVELTQASSPGHAEPPFRPRRSHRVGWVIAIVGGIAVGAAGMFFAATSHLISVEQVATTVVAADPVVSDVEKVWCSTHPQEVFLAAYALGLARPPMGDSGWERFQDLGVTGVSRPEAYDLVTLLQDSPVESQRSWARLQALNGFWDWQDDTRLHWERPSTVTACRGAFAARP